MGIKDINIKFDKIDKTFSKYAKNWLFYLQGLEKKIRLLGQAWFERRRTLPCHQHLVFRAHLESSCTKVAFMLQKVCWTYGCNEVPVKIRSRSFTAESTAKDWRLNYIRTSKKRDASHVKQSWKDKRLLSGFKAFYQVVTFLHSIIIYANNTVIYEDQLHWRM